MNLFLPDAYYDKIFNINYKKLKELNIKYLFFDVDNTILKYSENIPNEEIKKLFDKLKKEKFICILFSNSANSRIKKISEFLNVESYTFCMKPLKKEYKKVLKKYPKKNCVFIGDQIMTDVLGAKRNNFYVILLDRIDSKEPITTRFWRIIENKIIKKLNKKYNFSRGKYYE